MKNKRKSQTCIAILKNSKGKLVFAADRRVSWSHLYQTVPNPKVIKKEGVLFAGTGDWHIISLVYNKLKLPKNSDKLDCDADTFIYSILLPKLKLMLLNEGFIDEKGNLSFPFLSGVEDSVVDVEFLIGYKHRLYSIKFGSASAVISAEESAVPYAAGCGAELAWGSLLTSQETDMSVKDRLKKAIEVAAQVSAGCDGVCDIISE